MVHAGVAMHWFKPKGCHTCVVTGVQHTYPACIHIVSAGSGPACLVIGIRWVAAKARRPGFSGTHTNLEAFILWKRCLVKAQRCSPAPLMTLQFSCPGLETEPCDGYDWWNRDTHTHTHIQFHHRALWWIWLVKALNTVSWVLHFLPPRPRPAKLSRVSLDSGRIGLQINWLPVQSVGCVHLLSWRSLLFMSKWWRYWGWISLFRMDEILEAGGGECGLTEGQCILAVYWKCFKHFSE